MIYIIVFYFLSGITLFDFGLYRLHFVLFVVIVDIFVDVSVAIFVVDIVFVVVFVDFTPL